MPSHPDTVPISSVLPNHLLKICSSFQLIWTNYHPSLCTSEKIISVLQVGKRCARISAKSDPDGRKFWLHFSQELGGGAKKHEICTGTFDCFLFHYSTWGYNAPLPNTPHPLFATGRMLRINGFCEKILPSLTYNSCYLPCNHKICRPTSGNKTSPWNILNHYNQGFR